MERIYSASERFEQKSTHGGKKCWLKYAHLPVNRFADAKSELLLSSYFVRLIPCAKGQPDSERCVKYVPFMCPVPSQPGSNWTQIHAFLTTLKTKTKKNLAPRNERRPTNRKQTKKNYTHFGIWSLTYCWTINAVNFNGWSRCAWSLRR